MWEETRCERPGKRLFLYHLREDELKLGVVVGNRDGEKTELQVVWNNWEHIRLDVVIDLWAQIEGMAKDKS